MILKYFSILLLIALAISCNRTQDRYCVYNSHWDNLDTCIDLKKLDNYIKDYKLTDIDKFDKVYRFSIKYIQDTLKSQNEDIILYYVDSINKINDTLLFVSIKHKDSYLYDYVLHGSVPPVIGNISGKDRFYEINIIKQRLISENYYQ